MYNPLESHWITIKKILIYLKGTLTFGLQLHYAPTLKPLSPHVFCDADWAIDPDDIRSTFGAANSLGRILFHGGPRNNMLWPGIVEKLNIGLWHMLQLMLSRFRHCYKRSLSLLALLLSTVITSQLFFLHIILFCTPEQSIWK